MATLKSLPVLAALAAFAMVGPIPAPARAATLHVPSDYPTIQAGIDAAVSGDVVLIAPGTYSDYSSRVLGGGGFPWTACVFLKSGVRVESVQGPSVTTLDISHMQGLQPAGVNAFYLTNPATSLAGFTIDAKGGARGAVLLRCEDVIFDNCRFLNCNGGPSTGGAVSSVSNATFVDCTFENCVANSAGAIWQTDGAIVLDGSVFRNCGNGAVRVSEGTPMYPVFATITNCQFIDNWRDTSGGVAGLAVEVALGGTSLISNCLFKGNVNHGAGGGGLDVSIGAKTIENCVFIANGALGSNGQGGAISGATGVYPLIIRGNTFVDNYKTDNNAGGGTFKIPYAIFENNIVVGSRGGAAFSANTILESSCNVYWDNSRGVGVALAESDRIVDPLFCERQAYDLTLRSDSPCLPPGSLGCGLIGALGQGCGTISVESKSWGSIKGLWR